MKTGVVCFGVIVIGIAVLTGRFITLTGYNTEVEMYGPVMCLKMPSSQAPEDTQFINGTRVVLMGVDDRLTLWETPGKGPADTFQGGVTAMKLPKNMDDYPLIYPLDMKGWPKDVGFHPHGLHILNETLYATNHAYAKGGERIEVFGIEGIKSQLSLKYRRSIALPDYVFGITNDVLMVSDTDFFLTTWKPKPDTPDGRDKSLLAELALITEWLLGLKFTYLYRCKDVQGKAECTVVDSGITMNSLTRRGDDLYVSDTVARVIKQYHITATSAELIAQYPTAHMVDNIEYDAESDKIYLGVFGRLWDYMMFLHHRHSGDNVEAAIPGGCDEFDPKTGATRHVLMQAKQSGVSSCARQGMFIVMGSWHDVHALVCPLEDPKKKP